MMMKLQEHMKTDMHGNKMSCCKWDVCNQVQVNKPYHLVDVTSIIELNWIEIYTIIEWNEVIFRECFTA